MRRPGHDEWVKLIAEYEVSGLSQKEFVAKHDVSFSTFQYWLYRRNKKVRTVSGSTPEFVPVEVVDSAAPKARRDEAKAAVEIELPSGVQVRLISGVSASFVGELIAALK
jgi:transposase